MFCISYGGNNLDEFLSILKTYPLVEFRLDKCDFTIEQIKNALSTPSKVILTYGKKYLNETNTDLLISAIDNHVSYIDLDSDTNAKNNIWPRLLLAKNRKFKWKVGIEIPAIPGKEKEIKQIIDYFAKHIDFLNLNELEVADNKMSKLTKIGFRTKNQLSYAVEGSEELAKNLLKYCSKKHPKLNVHYCTATLKDKVQLANRIKLRAQNVAKEYDLVTKEGLLLRGAIYGDNEAIISILKKHKVPKKLYEVDKKRERVLTSIKVADVLKDTFKNNGAEPAIVEEYPTYDCLQIDVEFL